MRTARRNNRSTKTAKAALFESLETRQMMTATVANGTFDSATVVPDIYAEQNYNVRDTVNSANPDGFYKFYNLFGNSHLHVALDSLSADADVNVYDQNHNRVAFSHNAGTTSETLDVDLAGHQYVYVDVHAFASTATYSLFMYNDYAGSTLSTARDVGAAWGQSSDNFYAYGRTSYNDYLDYRDKVDIVKFKMEAPGTVSLRRLPVQNTAGLNATMQLLDSNGNVIASPSAGADTSINLDRKSLPAGTYYVKFTQSSGSGAYQFRITADYAGDTTGSARDLGDVTNSARELNDMVGTFNLPSYEDETDLYKFTLNKTSPVDLATTVRESGFDANLKLARDTNGDGTIETNEIFAVGTGATGQRKLSTTLNAGTYYVVVDTSDNVYAPYSSYTLDIDSDFDSVKNDPKAYTNLTKATNLGDLKGENNLTAGFGISAGDITDFYKFHMTADGQFLASATTNPYWSHGATNPSLAVIKDSNNNGHFDAGETVIPFATGKLTASLKAGNYILEVGGSGGTSVYDLRTVSNYAGSTLNTARKFGIISGKTPKAQVFNDYIEQDFGAGSNVDDFYSFNLTGNYQATFSTKGVDGEDLSLSLIKDVNGNGKIDAGDVIVTSDALDSPNESLTRTLGSGKYFVQVHGVNGSTNYKLTAKFASK